MDPYGFKHSDNKDWQEQDPEEWTPKHEYGGHRTPIRLEVLYMYLRTHVRAYACLYEYVDKSFETSLNS